jgi:phage tail sheath protein FI
MVGQTERGPTRPRMVTSWGDFQSWYGGLIDPTTSFLPFGARGFFDNGGQRLFVARVVRNGALASSLQQPAAGPDDVIFTASGPGTWGDNVFLRIQAGSQTNALRPTIRVTLLYYATLPPLPLVDPLDAANIGDANRREPTVVEDFDNLTVSPTDSGNFIARLNSASRLIQVAMANNGAISRPNDLAFAQLANGDDGAAAPVAADYLGNPALPNPDDRTGLAGIATIDEVAILTVPDEQLGALPGADRVALTNAVVNQCELLRDRFAVLNADANPADPGNINPPRDSSYAGFYHPWVRVFDTRNGNTHLVPPSGHVAGIFARSDIDRGVHKAPANEVVRGIINRDLSPSERPLGFHLTKGQQDILNPRGVNVIRDFRADRRGIRLWGARTISSDPEWRYVNVRRLFLYVEESIDEGTQWVVFEPNDQQTWARVRQTVRNFLLLVWRSGALMGLKEEEAFFVRCDRTTMTQADIDAGRLICVIGIAPVKPAEFVIFRISQFTASE